MPIPGDYLKAGWGVVRLQPWHLAGVFSSSVDAENLAQRLGQGYAVKYGDHVLSSPDFTFQTAQIPSTSPPVYAENRADWSDRNDYGT